ncbi:hypothetical protein V2J09_013077 [Rumex salicifolius]
MFEIEAIEIFVDNKSTIALAKNLMYHDRCKHIDKSNEFKVKYVKTTFTKPLNRFMKALTTIHFKATKRILRYIKGTISHGYNNSDWAEDIDNRKSIPGLLRDLQMFEIEAIEILVDNKSTTKNPVYHDRSKYIKTSNEIEVKYVKTTFRRPLKS